MRRTYGIAAVAAAVVAAAIGVFVATRPPAPQRAEYFIFGGTTTVELRGVPRADAESALAAIGQLLQRDQREWHPWEISDLMRLNAAIAQGESYRVPPGLGELIRRAQAAYELSDGLFNPAVGRLIGMWGFHTSDYPIVSPPPMDAPIAELLAARPSMADLTLADDGTASSRNRAVELDLNGMAEGFAAEQVAALLHERRIENALINLGGDVLALGSADGRPWRVAIGSPDHDVLAGVELIGHEALFSSGDYNKYREVKGERWAHVLDPRNGQPIRGVSAVSVIMRDAVVADVVSTTLMIAGPPDLVRLARRMGVSCVLMLTADDTLWVTPAMQRRIDLTRHKGAVRVTEELGKDCASAPVR